MGIGARRRDMHTKRATRKGGKYWHIVRYLTLEQSMSNAGMIERGQFTLCEDSALDIRHSPNKMN